MTAPVFLTNDQWTVTGTSGVLTGPEARHAVTIRRLSVGEAVDLCDGLGTRWRCRVTATPSSDELHVSIEDTVSEPLPDQPLTLIQALAKGGRDEQAVETATEVGVHHIIPWAAQRCIVQWKGPKQKKNQDKWQTLAGTAAKQSRRSWVPQVAPLHTTAELTEWIRQRSEEGGLVVLLHEESSQPIGELSLPEKGGVAVIVGPEGGIGEEESEQLCRAGAVSVRLGPHVLRAGSAGPIALAVLAQRAGQWG